MVSTIDWLHVDILNGPTLSYRRSVPSAFGIVIPALGLRALSFLRMNRPVGPVLQSFSPHNRYPTLLYSLQRAVCSFVFLQVHCFHAPVRRWTGRYGFLLLRFAFNGPSRYFLRVPITIVA